MVAPTLSRGARPVEYEALEDKLRDLERRVGELNEESFEFSDMIEGVRSLHRSQEELSTRISQLQRVTHAFLAAQSKGLDLAETPLPRFLPLRVYLSEDTPEIVESVKKAISGVLDVQGLEIADDFPAETGSWWKKWMVRSKDFLTQDEVAERLNKIERAVEMKVLHEPQADVDKKTAEAVGSLAKCFENVPNVAVQAGSILFLKYVGADGTACVQVRTLTQEQLVQIEKNPKLLNTPVQAISKLAQKKQTKQKTVGKKGPSLDRLTTLGNADQRPRRGVIRPDHEAVPEKPKEQDANASMHHLNDASK